MANNIVSFFDQFPAYNGKTVSIRGVDGYLCASDMSEIMGRRFADWSRTKFAKQLLARLSNRLGLSIDWENSPNPVVPVTHEDLRPKAKAIRKAPLIDFIPGKGQKVWVHPTVAMSYAMSNPEFQADINIWLYELMTLGTVNPHVLQWSREEYDRGIEMNRDDIKEMWG